MKYLIQLSVILLISLIGEVLHALIPLPVPAGIYGMILMFAALCLRIIRLENVRETALFLIEIMPVMFVPAAVGLLDSWNTLKSLLIPCAVAVIPVTLIVMAVSGRTTQAVIRLQNRRRNPQ